jgi:hypothetical protein
MSTRSYARPKPQRVIRAERIDLNHVQVQMPVLERCAANRARNTSVPGPSVGSQHKHTVHDILLITGRLRGD